MNKNKDSFRLIIENVLYLLRISTEKHKMQKKLPMA